MSHLWLLIFSLKLCLIFCQEKGHIVNISDGKIRGTINQTIGDNMTYYAFRGIPFAKKPLGNLRFASPEKNDPWTGILDATKDKDRCTQIINDVVVRGTESDVIGSEDCLYISVYTTSINGSLPVMVWIYGGGFIAGTSSYDNRSPDYIIEKDVIFVAFNYRLGVFGFLSTEDSVAPGNWGLKDQVLALKWVKTNIRYFGGDPNKVTIFGQSAGSASVSYLVQSNLTAGLYKGAIMESGTSLCLWALSHNARNKAFSVGAKLRIFTRSSQRLTDELRKINYKALKLAENNVTITSLLTESILAGLPFGVVMEPPHADAVFSGKSYELLLNGQFQKIPIIIGYTSNEGAALQAYIDFMRPALFQYDLHVSRLAPYDLTQNYLKRLPAGIDIKKYYFGVGSMSSQPANLTKFFTVDQFNRAIRETVNLISDYTDVYFYEFSYKGLLGNPNSTYEGVGHAEELNYLFAAQNQSSTPQDRLTREIFVTLWTNFVKTGNPTETKNDTLLQGVKWKPNTPSDNTNVTIKYLNINTTLTMENNPDQSDWVFYQGIYKRFGDPPYTTY